jgi:hypothetical protein
LQSPVGELAPGWLRTPRRLPLDCLRTSVAKRAVSELEAAEIAAALLPVIWGKATDLNQDPIHVLFCYGAKHGWRSFSRSTGAYRAKKKKPGSDPETGNPRRHWARLNTFEDWACSASTAVILEGLPGEDQSLALDRWKPIKVHVCSFLNRLLKPRRVRLFEELRLRRSGATRRGGAHCGRSFQAAANLNKSALGGASK